MHIVHVLRGPGVDLSVVKWALSALRLKPNVNTAIVSNMRKQ